MNLNDWLTIIGALGGLEAIKWIVNFFVNHRTNARKENASADGLEMQNLLIVINTLKDEIARVILSVYALCLRKECKKEMRKWTICI